MRRGIIVAVVLIVIVAGIVVARRRNGSGPAETMRTAQVTRTDIVVSVSATGSVEPASTVEVRSRGTGEVTRVTVEEGDRVAKGQVLVELDDPDARAAVELATAQLESVQAQVRELVASLAADRADLATRTRQSDAAVASARARLAEVRAGATAQEIQQAQESVRQAEAALARARENLSRQEQLLSQGFVPQATVDQARHDVEIATSQLRAAQAHLDEVRAGSTPEQIAQAEAALRQAMAQRDQVRASALQFRVREQSIAQARAQVAQARANLEQAQERLSESRVVAPITGVVVKRSVDVGQSVIGGSGTGGTLVITLAKVDPLYAIVNVDESDIAQIKVGMPVDLTADALPDAQFAGHVQQIAPEAQVVQNVTQFAVTVVIDKVDPSLRLGMTVDAEFVIAKRTDVLAVPQEAVRGKEQPAVLVVQGGRLGTRLVRTGITDGRLVEVVSGLREGETVYLGPARQNSTRSPQGRSPFQPQFQPRQQRPGGNR